MEAQELWTIIATVITFAGTIIGIVIGLYKHLDNKIESKDKDIDGKLKELRQGIVHDMEGLALVFYKLLEVLKDKDMLSSSDVFKVFGSEYMQRYTGKLSNPDFYKERRKAELLRKAQERTITYTEAKELEKLLEEQRQKHESSGDIVGAILAIMLLMALAWLISEIFGEKGRK